MNLEKLIKMSYKRLKSKERVRTSTRCPSEEDIACFIAGKLREKEKEKMLEHVLSCGTCEESLKNYFQLATHRAREGAEEVPEWLVSKVKRLMPESADEGILEAFVEFGKDFTRVVRTTGMILAREPQAVPAFRDVGEKVKEKSVTISKVADNFIVDIKIEKVKDGLANLTVYLKDKKTKKPSSGERVSLVYEGRELDSSLAEGGKVVFENIELKDYNINLIRKGEPVSIAAVFLRTLD